MVVEIQKIITQLSALQEIPQTFFQGIENANSFDDTLFPDWTTPVFSETDLKKKFKAVYDKYKAIDDKEQRDRIIQSFIDSNKIELLCNNDPTVLNIEISLLPVSIQEEIENLFLYLYSSALEYHKFETYTKDSIKKAIDRFITASGAEVCPLCGLEGYLNLEGQARIALDHWLCKDLFPFVSINFDNLMPIGDKCNSRPAKGTTNVLLDDYNNRKISYYPFHAHGGIDTNFSFINEPTIHDIKEEDWTLTLTPSKGEEQAQFESWNSIFNIYDRYKDYFRKYVFLNWENDYKEFITESGIGHANDIDELREKLTIWRAAFPIKKRAGAILYKAFISYLLSNASEAYLFSLCENFKRQAA